MQKYAAGISTSVIVLSSLCAGCAAPESKPKASPVAEAWQGRTERVSDASTVDGVAATSSAATPIKNDGDSIKAADPEAGKRGKGATAREVPVATVNGRAIHRQRMVELLMRSRGAELLEQFVVLEAAEGLAAQRNLSVSESDVAAEYERALRELTANQGAAGGGAFNRAAAESILMSVLTQRKVSHEEFMLGMRRNALLRRLANEEQVVTDAQVRAEFERQYGARARVSVVRVPTMNDVARFREQLANHPRIPNAPASSGDGGQPTLAVESWGPFSAEDAEVPAIVRTAAFTLQPGQVSDALRLADGLVLIRLEGLQAGRSEVSFEAVRTDLEAAVRSRLEKKAMADLYERLFLESMVKINDPTLKRAFEQSYPQRRP